MSDAIAKADALVRLLHAHGCQMAADMPPGCPPNALGVDLRHVDPMNLSGTLLARFAVPIRTVSEANRHEHWRHRARRVKVQREAVAWVYQTIPQAQRLAMAQAVDGGLVVTLTRVAPRPLDTDNLTVSMKACRDQLAAQLVIDDGSHLVKWEYAQRRGAPREYAVEIEVRTGDQP